HPLPDRAAGGDPLRLTPHDPGRARLEAASRSPALKGHKSRAQGVALIVAHKWSTLGDVYSGLVGGLGPPIVREGALGRRGRPPPFPRSPPCSNGSRTSSRRPTWATPAWTPASPWCWTASARSRP